jgi:hypothetical protein
VEQAIMSKITIPQVGVAVELGQQEPIVDLVKVAVVVLD